MFLLVYKTAFVVYCVEKHTAIIKNSVTVWKAVSYFLVWSVNFAGDELDCYISYNSANGKVAGDCEVQ